MILEIDNREPQTIKDYFTNSILTCNLKNLDQGDFIIKDCDENILLLFERKTISDLLSSVKDSRYSEQSERYSKLNLANNKICYILEGNLKNLQKDTTDYKTVYSCIFSLSYKKGFSILFTQNIDDTINIIEQFFNRINKLENNPEHNTINSNNLENNPEHNNGNLIKKQIIKPENINSYMLNLVPGIGLKTAIEILKSFDNTIFSLINMMKYDLNNFDNIMNNIKINSRKLSKKIIQNIKIYFLDNS